MPFPHGYIFHLPLGVVVVDAQIAVGDVLSEEGPVVEAVEQRLSERAFRLCDSVLSLQPGVKAVQHWQGFLLSHEFQVVTFDIEFAGCALYLVERLEHCQGVIASLLIIENGLDEISPGMRHAGDKSRTGSRAYCYVARESVALEQSFPAREELERSFSTAAFRVVEEVYRVVLVAKECPLAACLDVFLRAAVQYLDWSIVGGDYPRLEKKQMHGVCPAQLARE